MAAVAYNPNDPLEQAFLAALGQGETGGASNSATLGYGGTDLSGAATDQYGFPQWAGLGNSHAAGTFQFQPGTWDQVASEYGLNFLHPQDQSAAAWYYAQETDPTLYDDLRNGNFAKIQSALVNVWPSVTGNGAAPQGLANDIAANLNSGNYYDPSGVGHITIGGTPDASTSGTTPGPSSGSDSQSAPGFNIANPATWLNGAGDLFSRGALIVIGAVIIFVALWMLLSSQGWAPSPKQAARAAFKGA